MNRRRFLTILGGGLGAAALTCSGIALLGRGEPSANLIDKTIGNKTMSNNILVAYTSRSGATTGVAEAIGKQLATYGPTVDVRPIAEITDLGSYRAAVIGSAINGGAWLPDAVKFVETHQAGLNRMPTAIFLVCMMMAKPTDQHQRFIGEFLAPVRSLAKPVAEGRFAGALWPSKYSFFDGLGLRIFLAYLGLKEGDYRDWNAIRAWTESVRPLLLQ